MESVVKGALGKVKLGKEKRRAYKVFCTSHHSLCTGLNGVGGGNVEKELKRKEQREWRLVQCTWQKSMKESLVSTGKSKVGKRHQEKFS